MNITFLIPAYDSLAGGLRVVAQYADHLTRQGHTVCLISNDSAPPSGLRARLRKALKFERAPRTVDVQGAGHFEGLSLDIRLVPSDKRISTDLFPEADVLVATWWQTVEWMTHLPPEKGVHAHFIQDHEVFPYLPVDRVKSAYRQPTYKIVVASWLSEIMQKEYAQSSQIVPNGVNTVAFNTPKRRMNSSLNVGFLYSGSPRKNVKLALDAVRQARQLVPSIQIVAFGSKQVDHLPKWIKYETRPPQARIPEIYASCDVWLFTSESEGFGLPILEAMACRTPVLATAAGAAPDLVNGANGHVLPSKSTVFAKAIADMAIMPETDWQAMSDAARRTAEANDVTAAAARFEALLTKIV